MSKSAPTFDEYEKALHQMLDENEALQAELAQVRGRLEALMTAFDERGSLGILQVMAADKSLSAETRIRAASAAMPYERPKLLLMSISRMSRGGDQRRNCSPKTRRGGSRQLLGRKD